MCSLDKNSPQTKISRGISWWRQARLLDSYPARTRLPCHECSVYRIPLFHDRDRELDEQEGGCASQVPNDQKCTLQLYNDGLPPHPFLWMFVVLCVSETKLNDWSEFRALCVISRWRCVDLYLFLFVIKVENTCVLFYNNQSLNSHDKTGRLCTTVGSRGIRRCVWSPSIGRQIQISSQTCFGNESSRGLFRAGLKNRWFVCKWKVITYEEVRLFLSLQEK
jgi:hypothetical protein